MLDDVWRRSTSDTHNLQLAYQKQINRITIGKQRLNKLAFCVYWVLNREIRASARTNAWRFWLVVYMGLTNKQPTTAFNLLLAQFLFSLSISSPFLRFFFILLCTNFIFKLSTSSFANRSTTNTKYVAQNLHKFNMCTIRLDLFFGF